jgi:hypothetical protein
MRMMAPVIEGWKGAGAPEPDILHLAQRGDFERAVERFPGADTVLLGTPLYTDAMPALVKQYIEALAPGMESASQGNVRPTLGFLVQSGFEEALHSRPLERYFEKLVRRLGSPYAGTIVRGCGWSLQAMPESENRELVDHLRALGEQLARDRRFSEAELRAVAGTERFSPIAAAWLSLAFSQPAAIPNSYLDRAMEKNGVWDRRFAAPYAAALPT